MQPHNTVKDAEREKINKQIDAFFAAGGKISESNLSDVLQDTLDAIESYKESNGRFPRIMDLADYLGVDKLSVRTRLSKLQAKELIRLTQGCEIKEIL